MYSKEDNYCSWSPDSIDGVRFNYGCYLHDRQYRNEVKVRKTRKEADKELKRVIIKKYSDEGRKYFGYLVGWLYYIAVRLFAFRHWE